MPTVRYQSKAILILNVLTSTSEGKGLALPAATPMICGPVGLGNEEIGMLISATQSLMV